RVTGPGPRPPGNARVPRGDRTARPDPVTRPPQGPRRPPRRGARDGARGGGPRRPPRWLTIKRGEPGRRGGLPLLVVTIVLTLFAGRLVQLQGLDSAYYKAAAATEQVRVNPLPALRGAIVGANGQPLATTIETYTIAMDPTTVTDADKPAVAQQLA